MHHIICSAAPNHQLIDSMINLIRHVTEPGEYSSPARTERTSPAKNTAAYPAVATTHTCAAASNHGSDCVELVSSPTGKHTRTPLGLRALPAECASVARANLQPPTSCRRSQLTTSLSSQQATKNISAWKACMCQEGKSPYGLLVVCCYLFCSANFYFYG